MSYPYSRILSRANAATGRGFIAVWAEVKAHVSEHVDNMQPGWLELMNSPACFEKR